MITTEYREPAPKYKPITALANVTMRNSNASPSGVNILILPITSYLVMLSGIHLTQRRSSNPGAIYIAGVNPASGSCFIDKNIAMDPPGVFEQNWY
jgi:hypothetical protein